MTVPQAHTAIETSIFSDTRTSSYLSSTTELYQDFREFALGIDFGYGDIQGCRKSSNYYVRAVRGGLSRCPDCSGETCVVENVTFVSGTVCECVCTTSLTLGSGITIQSGATVTFKAPKVNLKIGFHAENGSVVRIKQQ